MEKSAIVPHISWSGPQPQKERDAYLLAMIVRVYIGEINLPDGKERDMFLHPSVFTAKDMRIIATMYAFYQEKMALKGVVDSEEMLKVVKGTRENEVDEWIADNSQLIREAEEVLIEFVETPGNPGFTVFG